MSKYSIADLEKLSGIKAHTIRIWEKRYNIVEPNRSDTNIRFYNDRQLRKILNISFLINNGFKISKLAKLENTDIELKVKESSKVSTHFESSINDIVLSALTFNKELFSQTFDSVVSNNGLSITYEKVIIPCLNKIGSLWSSGDLFPAQEHFLSNLIKQKFYNLLENSNTQNNNNGKTVLLFLPPWESHEFCLIYSEVVLERLGYSVINIGSSISIDSIYECINKLQPDYLFSTLIVGHKVTEIQKFCDGVNFHNKNGKFLMAGNINLLKLVNSQAKVFSQCSDFEMYFENQIK
jgi:DNA-binding transcriptional MerR regulator